MFDDRIISEILDASLITSHIDVNIDINDKQIEINQQVSVILICDFVPVFISCNATCLPISKSN